MPLFHSLACSLQPNVHSKDGAAQRHMYMHTQMNANAHTTLAQGLKQFHPCVSSTALVTFCPEQSLKSVPGTGGLISAASK